MRQPRGTAHQGNNQRVGIKQCQGTFMPLEPDLLDRRKPGPLVARRTQVRNRCEVLITLGDQEKMLVGKPFFELFLECRRAHPPISMKS